MTRTLIVLGAYLLSSIGIVVMLMLLGEGLRSPKWQDWLTALVWPSAWVVHVVMSVAWTNGRRLHWAWPLCGTVLGVGSFMVWPFTAMNLGFDLPGSPNPMVEATSTLMLAQFVLVAPCVLLGVWLVGYHARQKLRKGQRSPIPPAQA